MRVVYNTGLGVAYNGNSLDMLRAMDNDSINLVVTSPPFALLRQKEYGNNNGQEYINWLCEFGEIVKEKLTDDGSLVMDLGGAYQRGVPVRSLYNYKVLIEFCERLGFFLAEEFFWHNTSKLPSPIEWVNKRKIRVKDSVNTIWWFSKTEFPKADVRKVLNEYSPQMKKLLAKKEKYYNTAERPSGHNISRGFDKDNKGAIPSNLLQIANSDSSSSYFKYCKAVEVKGHPARFPSKLPEFFIEYLTDEDDLVVDIFAGSNTTGEVAERLNRKWISCELDEKYCAVSAFRFCENEEQAIYVYETIMNGGMVDFTELRIL